MSCGLSGGWCRRTARVDEQCVLPVAPRAIPAHIQHHVGSTQPPPPTTAPPTAAPPTNHAQVLLSSPLELFSKHGLFDVTSKSAVRATKASLATLAGRWAMALKKDDAAYLTVPDKVRRACAGGEAEYTSRVLGRDRGGTAVRALIPATGVASL